MATKASSIGLKPKGKKSTDGVDVNAVFQAAIKAGVVKGDTTVAEMAALTKNANIGTLGYAVAWDRYVAVVK